MRLRSKFLVAGAVASTVLIGGAAYAYWTTGGSGTGTAATSASVSDVELSGNLATALYPGATGTVTIKAKNTNPGTLTINTVYVSAAFATTTLSTLCPLAATALVGPFALAGGATTPVSLGDVNVSFENTAQDQSACINKPITISYSTVAPQG